MTQRLVKDINPIGSSSPNELIEVDGILYFVAKTETSKGGTEAEEGDEESDDESSDSGEFGLWKSDGTEGGTRLLASFDGISNLVEANGLLYFVGKTKDNHEIWSSDGTSSGTQKVKAFYPGGDGFFPYNLFAVDDTLFFSASGPEESPNGYELWRWEGDDVGTKLFRNLFPDRHQRANA